MDQRTLGVLLTVLAAALFGTLGIFGKGAVAVDLSVTTLLAGRFLVATLLLWGVLLYRGGPLTFRGAWWDWNWSSAWCTRSCRWRTSRASRGSPPASLP